MSGQASEHNSRSPGSIRARERRQRVIVGWREWIALPEWGIEHIKTKIDTGARTSAIHVDNIEELPGGRVRFDVIIRPASLEQPQLSVQVTTDVVRVSRVRPTTGKRQHRLVVQTRMKLGTIERDIEMSLVSRHNMLCRMLLGRSALKGVLVDPSRRCRATSAPQERGEGEL